MDKQEFINRVPTVETHTHFNAWVKDFPALHPQGEHGHGHGHHGHAPLPHRQQLLDHLRKELTQLSTDRKSIEQKLCYRSCFKIMDREYAEFCLKERCQQPDFKAAARAVNLLK